MAMSSPFAVVTITSTGMNEWMNQISTNKLNRKVHKLVAIADNFSVYLGGWLS
jgi:hypothetical protein